MKINMVVILLFAFFALSTAFSDIGYAADELVVTESGNVGIGVSNPLHSLSIAGGGIQIFQTNGIGFNGSIPYDGDAAGDRARIYYDGALVGTENDFLVIEKTDGNSADPDGGIAFTNKGSDNVRKTAMVIRGTGNVGIGTAAPEAKLHVNGSLRLSAGQQIYCPGRLHVHGEEILYILNKNGVTVGKEWGGSGDLRVQGNVGIGTDSPASMLHIKKDATGDTIGTSGIRLENPGTSDTRFAGSANMFLGWFYVDFLRFDINDNQIFVLNELGDATLAGTLTENSDIDLKDQIKPLQRSLDKITQLNGVNYKWKNKGRRGDKLQLGLIAQDVEKVFPEAVSEDTAGMKGIAYSRLIAPLIEAVKELKMENDELKKKYADLVSRVESLEKGTRNESYSRNGTN